MCLCADSHIFLFLCLARVKCASVQCGGLFEWSLIVDVMLNNRQLQRLLPEMESYYLLNDYLRDGDNELTLNLRTIQRDHKHVCISTLPSCTAKHTGRGKGGPYFRSSVGRVLISLTLGLSLVQAGSRKSLQRNCLGFFEEKMYKKAEST